MIINNMNVYVNVVGDSEKEIIFLHGWGQDSTTFNPVIEYLKDHYKIFLVDFPGFGKSDEPENVLTLNDYVEVLKKIIQCYKIKDPLIIGHSFGGRVAIKYTSHYEGVSKLILVNSAGLKNKRTWKYYYKVYTYKFFKRFFSLKPLTKYKDKVLSKYGSSDYKNASEMMKKILVNVVNEDLSNELKNIFIPVILFWGENDTVTPLEHALRMQEYLDDVGLVKVPNAGHFSYLEDPYLLYKVIEAFH
jgi:pimeloyl-ACP methyl ester carboxylesterase